MTKKSKKKVLKASGKKAKSKSPLGAKQKVQTKAVAVKESKNLHSTVVKKAIQTPTKIPEQKTKYGQLTKEPAKLNNVSQLKVESQQKKRLLKLKQELEYLNKKSEEEDLIKDVEGKSYCRDESCDQPAVTGIYCRYHYLALWKHLQTRKQLLKDNYLLTGIQKIVKSIGPLAWTFLLHDFKNEKNFDLAMKEMNLFVLKEEDSLTSETYES